ncbi:MAG: hypothetical protein GYA39_07220 [Methanothrix sp.]|nr:hypothetical protein [Methanothrix sp.]
MAGLWQSRFGIPEKAFAGYRFFRKAQSVWMISGSELPDLSYEALGMRIMNLKDRPWKPTTCALQILGKHATKNLVHLNDSQAMIFLEGKSLPIESNLEPGYVVVLYREEVLGCGLYSHGIVISQLPKERRTTSCS